jgi:hypothetical protein
MLTGEEEEREEKWSTRLATAKRVSADEIAESLWRTFSFIVGLVV